MTRFAGGNYIKRSGDTMNGDLSFSSGAVLVGGPKIKVGFYSGDGNDNRNIDIGVDLSSKNNVLVIIKTTTSSGYSAMFRVEAGQGDYAYFLDANVRLANTIQALTSTGFQVGTENRVNGSGIDYAYIVFWEEP